MILIFVIEIFRYLRGLEHSRYIGSDLFPDMEIPSGGAAMTRIYANRVTGPSYMLSQIFLAGPIQLMKAIGRFRSLIPYSDTLKARIQRQLEKIETAKKWQDLSEYRDNALETLYLIRMNKVQYSPRKIRIRSL